MVFNNEMCATNQGRGAGRAHTPPSRRSSQLLDSALVTATAEPTAVALRRHCGDLLDDRPEPRLSAFEHQAEVITQGGVHTVRCSFKRRLGLTGPHRSILSRNAAGHSSLYRSSTMPCASKGSSG